MEYRYPLPRLSAQLEFNRQFFFFRFRLECNLC